MVVVLLVSLLNHNPEHVLLRHMHVSASGKGTFPARFFPGCSGLPGLGSAREGSQC